MDYNKLKKATKTFEFGLEKRDFARLEERRENCMYQSRNQRYNIAVRCCLYLAWYFENFK